MASDKRPEPKIVVAETSPITVPLQPLILMAKTLGIGFAFVLSILLSGGPVGAQQNPLPIDGETIHLCSAGGLPLQASAGGPVEIGFSTNGDARWLVDYDEAADRYRFRHETSGLWLTNAFDPHEGLELGDNQTAPAAQWEISAAGDTIRVANTAVSVGRTHLSLRPENVGRDRDVILGGSGYQGAFWTAESAADGALCGGGLIADAVDDVVTTSVGRFVSEPLLDNDLPRIGSRRFYLPLEVVAGELPPGLEFNQGRLFGAATTPGTYSFDYRLALHGSSDTATVTVNIADGSLTTVANDDSATIAIGIRHEIDFAENDVVPAGTDGNNGAVVIAGDVPPGMRLAFNGVFVGRPEREGTYRFTYVISGTDGTADIADAEVTVQAGTQTVANDDTTTGRQGDRLSLDLLRNDTLSGPFRFIELVSGEPPPGMTIGSDSEVVGTPVEPGIYTLVYRLHSLSGSNDTATARFDIAPSDGRTVANDDFYELEVGTSLRAELMANDTFSASFLSFEVLSGEIPGVQVGGAGLGTGVLGGQPIEPGQFSLTYRITSTSGSSDTGTVTVTVTDAPAVIIEDVITGVDGAGVSGIEIRLWRRTGVFRGQLLYATTTTDTDGRFRFEAIRGDYNIYFSGFEDAVYRDGTGDYLWPAPERYEAFLRVEPGDVVPPFGLVVVDLNSTVAGTVTGLDAAGPSAGGVRADLFSASASGQRELFFGTTFLETNGAFELPIPAGRWAFTFTAPGNQVFPSGSRYLTVPVTVVDGERVEGIDVNLDDQTPQETTVSGRVTDDAGAAVTGVVIDRFAADSNGVKSRWLGDVRTGADGEFSATDSAGCYVYVFIAPSGRTFTDSSRWAERFLCLDPGEAATDVSAVLSNASAKAALGGLIDDTKKRAVPGVVVDLFRASADGGRGQWLGDELSGDDGRYEFQVEPGCYVIVVIAPDQREFPGSGQWRRISACVEDGQSDLELNATLS